jgi:hypothetical protein
MTKTYGIAMERTDATTEDPFITYPNKATAIRVAKDLAKKPSFDCVKIWVLHIEEDMGVWSAPLPKWEG